MKKLITLALAVLVTVSAVVAKPKISKQELYESCVEEVESIVYNHDSSDMFAVYILMKAYPGVWREVTAEYLQKNMDSATLKEFTKRSGLTLNETVDFYLNVCEEVILEMMLDEMDVSDEEVTELIRQLVN